MANKIHVLIADDQPDVREALRLLLKAEGYETQAVASPAEVLAALDARDFDAILMDLNYARDTTSGQEGLDLLARVQAMDSALPVVVMTAWGSVELAVEAMRRGARDFVQKPWENARLLAVLRTQIELRQTLRHALRLEAENRLLRAAERPTLIAESPAMRPVLDLMQTLPTFVYLTPTLVLFGLGIVPGLISTIIFALPAPNCAEVMRTASSDACVAFRHTSCSPSSP